MQVIDVGGAYRLVDLVDAGVDDSQFHDRAPRAAMNRPSEVPPPVDSLGGAPATAAIALHTASDSGPCGV